MSSLLVSILLQAAEGYEWRSINPITDNSGRTMGFNFGNGGGVTLPDGTTFNFGGGGGVYFANNDQAGPPLDQKLQGALAKSIDWSSMPTSNGNSLPATPCDEYHLISSPQECLEVCLPSKMPLKKDTPFTAGACPNTFEKTSKTSTSFKPVIDQLEVQVCEPKNQASNLSDLQALVTSSHNFISTWLKGPSEDKAPEQVWNEWTKLLNKLPTVESDTTPASHCVVQHQLVKGGTACLQTCNSPIVASLDLMRDGPCRQIDGDEVPLSTPLDSVFVSSAIFSSAPVVLDQPKDSLVSHLSLAVNDMQLAADSKDMKMMTKSLGRATSVLQVLTPDSAQELIHTYMPVQFPDSTHRALRAGTSDLVYCFETMANKNLLSAIAPAPVESGPCEDRTNQISSDLFNKAVQVQSWMSDKRQQAKERLNSAMDVASDSFTDAKQYLDTKTDENSEQIASFIKSFKDDIAQFIKTIITQVQQFVLKFKESISSKDASAYLLNASKDQTPSPYFRVFEDGCVQMKVPANVEEMMKSSYGLTQGTCPKSLKYQKNFSTNLPLPTGGVVEIETLLPSKIDDYTIPLKSITWPIDKKKLQAERESAEKAAKDLYLKTISDLKKRTENLGLSASIELAAISAPSNEFAIPANPMYWPIENYPLRDLTKSLAVESTDEPPKAGAINLQQNIEKIEMKKKLDQAMLEAQKVAESAYELALKSLEEAHQKIQAAYNDRVEDIEKSFTKPAKNQRKLREVETVEVHHPKSKEIEVLSDYAERMYGLVKSSGKHLKGEVVEDSKQLASDFKTDVHKFAKALGSDDYVVDKKDQFTKIYTTLGDTYKSLGEKLEEVELEKKKAGDSLQSAKNDALKTLYKTMGDTMKKLGDEMQKKFTTPDNAAGATPQPAPFNWGKFVSGGAQAGDKKDGTNASSGGFDYSKYMGGGSSGAGAAGGFDYSKFIGGGASGGAGGFDYSQYMGGASSTPAPAGDDTSAAVAGGAAGGFDYSKFMAGGAYGGAGGFNYQQYIPGAVTTTTTTTPSSEDEILDKVSGNYAAFMGKTPHGPGFDYSKHFKAEKNRPITALLSDELVNATTASPTAGGFDYSKYMGGGSSGAGAAGGFDYSKFIGGGASGSAGGFDYSQYMGGASSTPAPAGDDTSAAVAGGAAGGFDYSKYMGGASSGAGGAGGFDYSQYMGGASSTPAPTDGASTPAASSASGFSYGHFVDRFKSFNYKDYMGSKPGQPFDYSSYTSGGGVRGSGPSATGFEKIGQATLDDNDMYCMGVECPATQPYCDHGVCTATPPSSEQKDLDCRWSSCPLNHSCDKKTHTCQEKTIVVTE